ncbi:hypothetical protein ACHAWF_002741 [Thalassiosira exigua]
MFHCYRIPNDHNPFLSLLRRGEPMVAGVTAGSYMNVKRVEAHNKDCQEQNLAFLAPCATLIGNVHLASNASIFYKSILKADVAAHGVNTICSEKDEEQWKSLPVGGYERKKDAGLFNSGSGIGHPTFGGDKGGGIYVGEGTNIQDACVVTSYEGHTTIGKYVTVGHAAHIHSASVGDESLIGMGAILKPGSIVESQSFVAAGAVVDRGSVVKGGEIWGGNPARKLRDLTEEEKRRLRRQAEKYVTIARSHAHVMELGGNVPDSFVEFELLGMGAAAGEKTFSDHEMMQESKETSKSKEKSSAEIKDMGNTEPVLVNGQSRQPPLQEGNTDEVRECTSTASMKT